MANSSGEIQGKASVLDGKAEFVVRPHGAALVNRPIPRVKSTPLLKVICAELFFPYERRASIICNAIEVSFFPFLLCDRCLENWHSERRH